MKIVPQKGQIPIVLTMVLVLAGVSMELVDFLHVDHDCSGEDCPICLQIQIFRNVLEALGRAAFIAFFMAFICKAVPQLHWLFRACPVTPVSLKVKSIT